MRKTLTTGLLLLALSCPVFAGEMLTPPAPQPMTAQEPTDNMTINGISTPPSLSESLTQITLEVLALLPSLL